MVAEPESDIEIEDTEPNDEDAPSEIRYEINSFPADFTVKVMYEKWRQKQLIVPEFQRRYVWNLPQASRLIESFLLGLPIPQVFLYRERESPKLLVVDGHQRLGTIARFYEGSFDGKRVFKLSGVGKRWNGLTYNELSDDDRIALDDTTLRSIVIQQSRPNNDSSVYQIFERLNTSGTQLNAMEIRKALYHEVAYPLLDSMSRVPAWWRLLGLKGEDRRLKDVELVLRVLALTADWTTYTKPMKDFITLYMQKLDKTSKADAQQMQDHFAATCSRVLDALGDKPFHLRGRLNVGALDAVMSSLLDRNATPRTNWAEAYESLKADEVFKETTESDTSDASVVKKRLTRTREFLLTP